MKAKIALGVGFVFLLCLIVLALNDKPKPAKSLLETTLENARAFDQCDKDWAIPSHVLDWFPGNGDTLIIRKCLLDPDYYQTEVWVRISSYTAQEDLNQYRIK